MDYNQYQTTPAIPEASSMIETFRAIGYSIEAAVADILDNSISAGSQNIWIDFDWRGDQTWLAIKDDGIGMDNTGLIQAMKPGSKNPDDQRGAKDLGRFGLGLKTASFSQCRVLTVISKIEHADPVFWTWNLDFVKDTGKWELIKYLPDSIFEHQINETKSGTIVIWNNIDRLVKHFSSTDKSSLDKFLIVMEHVKNHVAMVFHRFIEAGKVKIWFQKRLVEAWDPFLISNPATQHFPEEPLVNGRIKLRGFVLPHKSRLKEDEFRKAEGPKGWNEQQGFYVYRNERLLVAGDWLGMFRKEEHYKLTRILVDLPNNLDAEWQIDIKKSVARPPLALRDQIRAYASRIRSHAVEVYRHKGKVLQRKYAAVQFQPVWHEKLRHGKRFYEINRDHPVLKTILSSLDAKRSEVNELLKFIEETVPVPLITIKESENPENQGQPFEGLDQNPLLRVMKQMFDKLVNEGKSEEQAKAIILNIEPFNIFPQFIEHLNQ